MNNCLICGKPTKGKVCKDHVSYGHGLKCKTCGKPIFNGNKTGFCAAHNKNGKNNPFYGKKHSKETVDKIKITCTENSTELWKNSSYRTKIIQGVSKPRKETFKKEQSDRIKKWYEDNPEQKELRRTHMKNSWKTGKIIPKENISVNASKIEKRFFSDVQHLYGDSNKVIKSTIKSPDGTWIFPDLIIVDIHHIIEFFGNYWHANPSFYSAKDIVHHGITAEKIWNEDKKRIEKLCSLGYAIEIVWEEDYKKDKKGILNILDNYLNWESCCF